MTKNVRFAFIQKEGARVLGSPRRFTRHGKSGRAGKASEVAELVVLLASNRAGFISGTAVDIDGGHSVYRADA